ncbi:FUSC family protein [Auraticoccus sp. F435]|uniref:FUSC family protein n=1 Tax=Auraticoccus cholistanensis TaxID=2656650 RepID=A0A6A9V013_9ACTN|nr:FUSC family protein [Auraticoccus cholistanensis]MVA74620.1 FUSC family protein [Auraticoccus cholistanensis]
MGAWEHLRVVVRETVRRHPAEGSSRVAVRAALTMLVPLLVLAAAGRLEWGLYATFGAFASLYGGRLPLPGRWRVQLRHGALLSTLVVVGTAVALSPHRGWLSVPVAAAVAGAAALLSDRQGWRPPGALFPVFAVSACASVPAAPAGLVAAAVVGVATAAWAVLLGALEQRLLPAAPRTPPPPVPTAGRPGVRAARCAGAVALAGALATASGTGHPYWAMVAAVVPMSAATVHTQLARGVQRAVGTVLGLVLAAALLSLPLPVLAVVLLAAVLQGVAELLVGRNYAAALVVITPLALLMGQLAVPHPVGELVGDRLVQTLLGVVVGLAAVVWVRDRSAQPG